MPIKHNSHFHLHQQNVYIFFSKINIRINTQYYPRKNKTHFHLNQQNMEAKHQNKYEIYTLRNSGMS